MLCVEAVLSTSSLSVEESVSKCGCVMNVVVVVVAVAVAVLLLVVVVVVVVVVIVSRLALRRGAWRICYAEHLSLRFPQSVFTSSAVNVQASDPYRTVEVTIAWNSRKRSDRGYLCSVSSCLSLKNFRHAAEIQCSFSVWCGSLNESSPKVFRRAPCRQNLDVNFVNRYGVWNSLFVFPLVVVVEDFGLVWMEL